jgi:hypothetical protein
MGLLHLEQRDQQVGFALGETGRQLFALCSEAGSKRAALGVGRGMRTPAIGASSVTERHSCGA